jgi:hypothetical protein
MTACLTTRKSGGSLWVVLHARSASTRCVRQCQRFRPATASASNLLHLVRIRSLVLLQDARQACRTGLHGWERYTQRAASLESPPGGVPCITRHLSSTCTHTERGRVLSDPCSVGGSIHGHVAKAVPCRIRRLLYAAAYWWSDRPATCARFSADSCMQCRGSIKKTYHSLPCGSNGSGAGRQAIYIDGSACACTS